MKKNAVKKKTEKNLASISSTRRLEDLLNETEKELSALEPQIEKLEKQLEKLRELKLAKQKLITLKLSIKSILANFSEPGADSTATNVANLEFSQFSSPKNVKSEAPVEALTSQASVFRHHSPLMGRYAGKMFLPEQAFREVNTVLRRKDSLNYELFRAIVFNGGIASTEAIKAYLVEHRIKQPSSGEGFEHVELTDISSRVNYLVRKGVVIPDGRGQFISSPGWTEPG